jgi:hypothetical protein
MGSSPDKIGFVLEATGRTEIAYAPVSRQWLASESYKKKSSEFDALFGDALCMIAPGGPCSELVFVDYADTFSTIATVESMLRKWHPDVRAKSRFVAMFDRGTNAESLKEAKKLDGWTALQIHPSVWSMSKKFRCTPPVDSRGRPVVMSPIQLDECDAVRCLLQLRDPEQGTVSHH